MGQSSSVLQTGNGPAGRRGPLWWTGRILAGLGALLIVLALAGALYQTWASIRDRQKYPPPGELVNVGGYQLHIYCTGHKQGDGSPTVVLEAAQGGNWLDWSPVQDKIAAFAHVCAYDRAGCGWSDALPSPRHSSQVAESLHTLLHNAGVEGPYVLVGHSIGGIYVRAFANRAPDEVAGIVLVDSSHELQAQRLPPEFLALDAADAWMLPACRLAAPIGLVRLLKGMDDFAPDLPYAEQREVYVATTNRTHFCRTLMNEQAGGTIDEKQPTLHPSLGDIPLAVLSAGVDWAEGDPDDSPPAATAEILREAYSVWMELQRDLAGLSSGSTHLIAEESRHFVHHDQPDLVVDAIRQVVESVQP
jgi:pimeloyl-ACP methyl ester carboxylesterase